MRFQEPAPAGPGCSLHLGSPTQPHLPIHSLSSSSSERVQEMPEEGGRDWTSFCLLSKSLVLGPALLTVFAHQD